MIFYVVKHRQIAYIDIKKVNINWNISLNDQNMYNEIINFLAGQNGVLKKNNIKNDFIKSL